MTTHEPFLRAIAAHPADMRPRLAYADWLEEREREDVVQAEYIRTAVEFAGLGMPSCSNPDAERCGNWPACVLRARLDALLTPERRAKWTMRGLPEEWSYLPEIETDRRNLVCPGLDYFGERHGQPHGDFQFDFHAGCVEVVTCAWPEWSKHHAAICAAHPVRKVRLTTEPDYEGMYVVSKSHGIDWEDGDEYENTIRVLAAELPGPDPSAPIAYELVSELAREPEPAS